MNNPHEVKHNFITIYLNQHIQFMVKFRELETTWIHGFYFIKTINININHHLTLFMKDPMHIFEIGVFSVFEELENTFNWLFDLKTNQR